MTNITDQMIDAGARILDPLLSTDCPRQVARDVYAAMEEARRGDPTDVAPPKTTLRPFAFAESQVYEVSADRIGRVIDKTTATSDGRW